jgi:hypothetical protein
MSVPQRLSSNDHLSNANKLLLQDLGERLGLPLLMPERALRLTDEDGNTCILEITEDGQFWVIHSVLHENSQITPAMLAHYLRLNSSIELMKGASVCLEADTETIRLCMVLPEQRLTTESFENALMHITQLCGELMTADIPN